MLMGIGASAEGVLAAAPLKVLGGEILTRFKPRSHEDEIAIKECGIKDINRILSAEDLAGGNKLTFTATGVLGGPLIDGVLFKQHRIVTHSIVIRAKSGTVRYITAHHNCTPDHKYCQV